MDDLQYFTLARAIHVAGVVLWIGGVAFVTTVLIPSLRRMDDADQRLALFERLEGRFATQAKFVTLITGISGFLMLDFMDAWDRYLSPAFWWIHLMTLVWVMFTLVLFVLEPLVLHRWFHEQASRYPERAFLRLHAMHKILLVLSLVTVFGAVLGAHGFQYY